MPGFRCRTCSRAGWSRRPMCARTRRARRATGCTSSASSSTSCAPIATAARSARCASASSSRRRTSSPTPSTRASPPSSTASRCARSTTSRSTATCSASTPRASSTSPAGYFARSTARCCAPACRASTAAGSPLPVAPRSGRTRIGWNCASSDSRGLRLSVRQRTLSVEGSNPRTGVGCAAHPRVALDSAAALSCSLDPSLVRHGRVNGRYFRENFAQGGIDLVQIVPELVTNADSAIAVGGRPSGRIVLRFGAPDSGLRGRVEAGDAAAARAGAAGVASRAALLRRRRRDGRGGGRPAARSARRHAGRERPARAVRARAA